MNRIGNLITKYRRENKITQKEFADMLGVSNTAVSKWECGSNLPDISMLKPLSKILNVPVLSLIDDSINLDKEQLIREKDYQKEKDAKEKLIKEQEEYKRYIIKLRKKLKCRKILIIITIFLVVVNLIFIINLSNKNKHIKLKNNEYENNKTIAYKIVSEDENLSLEAIIIIQGSNVFTNLNYLTYHENKRGTGEEINVISFELKIIVDNNVIYTIGHQQKNNKNNTLNELIKNTDFNSKTNKTEITNAINKINVNSDSKLIINYKNENSNDKNTITIPLKFAEFSE